MRDKKNEEKKYFLEAVQGGQMQWPSSRSGQLYQMLWSGHYKDTEESTYHYQGPLSEQGKEKEKCILEVNKQ